MRRSDSAADCSRAHPNVDSDRPPGPADVDGHTVTLANLAADSHPDPNSTATADATAIDREGRVRRLGIVASHLSRH